MASKSTYPLYNTTYTLHRLSPLHAFPALSSAPDLAKHAKSLLSILRGDVLRGVRVRAGDGDDEALGRAGKLKSVSWKPLTTQARWREQQQEEEEEEEHEATEATDPRGVVIEIIYEKTTYTALLLLPITPSPPTASTREFTSLPLLLSRLPKSLRETLVSYLESAFDTLPLPLCLDSHALKKMLEKWIDATLVDAESADRDVQLVFSPPLPTSLKAITITVPRADVVGFYKRGKKLVAAGDAEEGAFFEALRHYAKGTMGLDIAALSVMKVACGGFVVGVGAGGGPGKVKVFIPRDESAGERAAEGLVEGLVEASLVAG